MREDYPQARAPASQGRVTAEVALASANGRQGAVRAPELPMLALSQQQRASSVHRQLWSGGRGSRRTMSKQRLYKLEAVLAVHGSRIEAVAPLFAALLSIPFGSGIRRWRPAPRNSAAGRAAARLAAGVPVAPAGTMGRAARRCAPAQTPFHAALGHFSLIRFARLAAGADGRGSAGADGDAAGEASDGGAGPDLRSPTELRVGPC